MLANSVVVHDCDIVELGLVIPQVSTSLVVIDGELGFADVVKQQRLFVIDESYPPS